MKSSCLHKLVLIGKGLASPRYSGLGGCLALKSFDEVRDDNNDNDNNNDNDDDDG